MFAVCAQVSGADVAMRVNWPDYLARCDLYYKKTVAAQIKWDEGPTLGDGNFGAVMYKPDAKKFQWDLSRIDLIDHRNQGDAGIKQGRLPVGYFNLTMVGTPNATPSWMRHDIWNNEVRAHLETSSGTMDIRCFIHANDSVMVVEVTTTGGESDFTWTFTPIESKSNRANPPAGYKAYPFPAAAENVSGTMVRTQEMPSGSEYFTTQPGQYATAWRVVDASAGKKIIYCNLSFSYPGTTAKQTAVNMVNRAATAGIDAVVASHRTWWHTYYQRSFVSVPDNKSESFYWYQMVRMAETSRGHMNVLVDLLGPWYGLTNWPMIYWEVNAQIGYIPYATANHIEEGLSILNSFETNLANLKWNVKNCTDCITVPHNSGQDLLGGGQIDATNPGSNIDAAGMTWALYDIWRFYRYTMDQKILERLFPLLKMNMNFMIGVMGNKKSDGKYHFPTLFSPEYGSDEDCSFHIAFARWCAIALIEANKRLGKNDPLLSKWQDIRDNVVDYPVNSYGYMVGKTLFIEADHRHPNHLSMIYPLYLETWDDASKRDLIKKSIDNWLRFYPHPNRTGFMFAGAASLYATIGDAAKSWQYFNLLKTAPPPGRYYMSANTTHLETSNPAPTIGAGLQGAECLNDFLIQSWNGIIRIFPTLPTGWNNISFHKLLADGGFEVSAVRKNGTTQFVRVKSFAGEPCKIKSDLARPLTAINVAGSRQFTISDANNITTIDLQKDEIVILHSQGATPDLTIEPAPLTGTNCNCYVDAFRSGTCYECTGTMTAVVWNPSQGAYPVSSCGNTGRGRTLLYDMSGRLIASDTKSITGIQGTLNRSKRAGIYFLVVENGDKVAVSRKVMVVK
jgi:hypothetical protein